VTFNQGTGEGAGHRHPLLAQGTSRQCQNLEARAQFNQVCVPDWGESQELHCYQPRLYHYWLDVFFQLGLGLLRTKGQSFVSIWPLEASLPNPTSPRVLKSLAQAWWQDLFDSCV
jgi:hypothetical protein